MDDVQREQCVCRIISASLRFRHERNTYRIDLPTREERLDAALLYEDVYEQALLDGAYSDDGVKAMLVGQGMWSAADDKKEKELKDDIENLKVNLFHKYFKKGDREVIRGALANAKAQLSALRERRHQFDYVSASYIAGMARLKALVVAGLKTPCGRRVWGDDAYLNEHCPVVEAAVAAWCNARLGEADFRELARTEPWRSIWQSRASCASNVFGLPAADLSDDQRNLVGCSMLLDNVREHPETPSDEVIEDDDALDGWLLHHRREREREQAKRQAETVSGNQKIADAPEQFLTISDSLVESGDMAKIAEEANRILGVNDPKTRRDLKVRAKVIREKGDVDETSLPDVQQALQMQARQQEAGKR